MVGIDLENVGLQFRVRRHGRVTLKEFVVRQLFRQSLNPYIEVNALNGINLRVREGERVGLLGHNGAGKSTLLKLLAGIYPATEGKVEVRGKVNSMLDIGVGIESDATGWENISYRGFLQGDSPAEIREKKQAIADFSELGSALEMPVRFYSSGMMVRLLFSIATAIEPEVLLIDEILSAGDLGFQEKARRRMLELIEKARVMVIASHDLSSLRQLCQRVLWLERGQVRMAGTPEEVIPHYEAHMRQPTLAAA